MFKSLIKTFLVIILNYKGVMNYHLEKEASEMPIDFKSEDQVKPKVKNWSNLVKIHGK